MKNGHDVSDKGKEKDIDNDSNASSDKTEPNLQSRFMELFDKINLKGKPPRFRDQHFRKVYDFLQFFKKPPLNEIFNFNQVIEVGPSKGATPLILILQGRNDENEPVVLDSIFEHFPVNKLDFNVYSEFTKSTPLKLLVDLYLNRELHRFKGKKYDLEKALELIPLQLDFDMPYENMTIREYLQSACPSTLMPDLMPRIDFYMSMRESMRLVRIWEQEQTDENLLLMQQQMRKTEQLVSAAFNTGLTNAYCQVANIYFELTDTINFNRVMQHIREMLDWPRDMSDIKKWYNQKLFDFAWKCLDASKPDYVKDAEKRESEENRNNRILCALRAAQSIKPQDEDVDTKDKKKKLCQHLGFMYVTPNGLQSGGISHPLFDRLGANKFKLAKVGLNLEIEHKREMEEKQKEIEALREQLKKATGP